MPCEDDRRNMTPEEEEFLKLFMKTRNKAAIYRLVCCLLSSETSYMTEPAVGFREEAEKKAP